MDEKAYQEIMQDDSVLSLPIDGAITQIGELVDYSGDHAHPDGCHRAIALADTLATHQLSDTQKALLDYCVANAWANLNVLKPGGKRWEWEQEELAKQILHLRKALSSEGFGLLPKIRRCEILVNLGNLMSEVGRCVDALAYWRHALEMDPEFGMAAGNLGMGLSEYARCLYDHGHSRLFLLEARQWLTHALAMPLPVYGAARKVFERRLQSIEEWARKSGTPPDVDLDDFSLGETSREERYRRWGLDNILFINPLNDLFDRPIAARDVMSAPSIVVSIDEGPYYAGFFDQMKQEYASSRFLLWEGLTQKGTHFSDREVKLLNTLDYPVYGLFVEKAKCCFRTAYSILDKIAYFLNHYLDLGCPLHQTYFRTIWYSDQKRDRGLRSVLFNRKNNALRGLYWLSLDLFSDQPGFKDSLEPAGKGTHEIRRNLEHRYLKLHTEGWSGPSQGIGLDDRLAFSLRVEEFEHRTLKLLQLVRSALIYLVLGIHIEEAERARHKSEGAIIPGMELPPLEDNWKARL